MPNNDQKSNQHCYNDSELSSSRHNNTNGNFNRSPSQHEQQDEQVKLPYNTFLLSNMSSLSLPSYCSGRILPAKANASFSQELFAYDNGGDGDVEPLDLSLRSCRKDQAVKQDQSPEHTPVCMVKSCSCLPLNTRLGSMSPDSIRSGVSGSPDGHHEANVSPGHAYSPVSNHPQTTGLQCGNGFNSRATTLSPSTAQPSTWSPSETSSFQLLSTSNRLLNESHNSVNLFRPYDDHLDPDLNPSIENHQTESTSTEKQVEENQAEDDGPTYMDLDAAAVSLKTSKHTFSKDYFKSTNNFDIQTTPGIITSQDKSGEDKLKVVSSTNQAQEPQAQKNIKDCASIDRKSIKLFIGGVISHTSLEKNQKEVANHTNTHFISSVTPRQQTQKQQKGLQSQQQGIQSQHQGLQSQRQGQQSQYRLSPSQHQELESQNQGRQSPQGILPDSSSVPSAPQSDHQINYPVKYESLTTDSEFQYSNSNENSLTTSSGNDLLANSASNPTSLSPPIDNFHFRHLDRGSPLNKSNGIHSPKTRFSSSTASQSKVSTLSRMNGHRLKRVAEDTNISSMYADSPEGPRSPDHNENSNKISLLDFWISKILMERSFETPPSRKPCNVDYICTANGEKRIRLRLVDLMELQVEQSLKA